MAVHFAVGFCAIAILLISGSLWSFTTAHASLALLVFSYVLAALLFKDALVFFLAFPLLTTLGPMVASVTYLEFGNFISEQGIYGYPTGATSRLVFYCLVLFVCFYYTVRLLVNKMRPRAVEEVSKRFTWTARAFHVASLACGLGILLYYGSPLLRGEDRFAYWESLPEVFSRLPYLFAMMSFLVVCAASVWPTRRNLLWAGVLIFASVGMLLFFSEKFTGLFLIFVLAVTAAYTSALFHRNAAIRVGRLIALCGSVGVALLGVACVGYMVFYGYTTDTVLAKLADRALALNGHVWFTTDLRLQEGAANGPMQALFPASGHSGLTGIQQLMYLVAPADFVERMIDGGLRFANVGFPLPLWVLGYVWATAYFGVGGVLAGLVLAYLMFSVARMNPISILVALNGLRQVTNALLVGDVSDLYKPLAIATWLFMSADLARAYVRSRRSRSKTLTMRGANGSTNERMASQEGGS